jgi:AcrR family transcriptional regulator
MSTSKRRKATYHHGDLAATLLQAAGKILEKEGIAALTIRALARRAGVSHAAPSRHFPDRDALLAALAAEGFAQLGAAQKAAAASGGLRAMGEAYVAFALENPQRFRLLFGGVAIAKHVPLREIASKVFDGLSGALAERTPAAEGARDASIAAWALVHGLALLLLEEKIATGALRGRDRAAFVRDVLSSIRFAAGAATSVQRA